MNDEGVRSFADSTTMLLISRIGMSFGVPMMLAMMVWLVSSVNALQIQVGVMKSQIEAGLSDRYHGTDALKDFALRDARIDRNAQDIIGLATRVDRIERRQLGPGLPP